MTANSFARQRSTPPTAIILRASMTSSCGHRHQLHRPMPCDLAEVHRYPNQHELSRSLCQTTQMMLPPPFVLLIITMPGFDYALSFHIGFAAMRTAKLLSHILTKPFTAIIGNRSFPALGTLVMFRAALACFPLINAHHMRIWMTDYTLELHSLPGWADYSSVLFSLEAANVVFPSNPAAVLYSRESPIRQEELFFSILLHFLKYLIIAEGRISQDVLVGLA